MRYIIFSLLAGVWLSGVAWSQDLALDQIDQHTVESIQLEGNQYISSPDILAMVTLNVVKNTKVTLEDVKSDVEALYLTGYFSDVRVIPQTGPRGMVLVYRLKENPLIKDVVITGNEVLLRKDLLSHIKTQPNTVLSYRQIEQDITTLETYYSTKGYTLARVVQVNYDEAMGRVQLTLYEGKIGSIFFAGNTHTRDFLVYREMEQQPGVVFNETRLRKDRERIIRLGYFSTVSAPRLVPAINGNVDVWFDLVERKINALGLSLEEGDRGINAVSNIQLNNVLNTGETLTAKVQYGADNIYSLHYFEPWLGNHHVSLGLDSWLQINKGDFESRGYNIELGKPFDDYLKTFISYRSEAVKLTSYAPNINYDKRSLGLAFSYDTRNDLRHPKNGMVLYHAISQGGDLGLFRLGGIDFSKYTAEYSFFNSFNENRHTLAWHISSGVYSTTYSYDREAAKFIVGGTYTVRGYRDQLDTQEGVYKLVSNLEYRMDINEYFNWVLFYDLGEAYNTTLSTSSFLSGYGLGMRVSTPLGPLRFDLARSAIRPLVFHFGLGEMF